MGDYDRSTREIKLQELSAETRQAIEKHIEFYNLGAILDDAIICVESNSEKFKKGLFSGPGARTLKVVILLTPRWLLQTIQADKEAAFARSAQLKDITVTDYEKSPFYSRIPDSGVEVTGGFTDSNESSTSFIGLGKDAAGDKFKTIFIDAVQRSKL